MALPSEPVTLVLGALAVIFWIILYRWYSLFDHYSTPHFAFDKIPDHFDSPILQYTTLLFLALALIYVVIYALLRKKAQISRSLKLTVVVLVAMAAVINIGLYPVGAVDVYSYITQLKLAYHYHQNPYVVTFSPAHLSDPFAMFSFMLNMPLPYGPAWLLISWLPTAVTGFSDVQQVLLGLKVFNVVLLVLTALVIYRYQNDDKSGWLAAYLFLANPLVLFEGVGNAHNDVLMAMFLILAVLALKRQSWLAAPLLMLSALVKFFSATLIPLFFLVMMLRRWSKQRLLVSMLLSAVVVFLVSAPSWENGKMIGGLWAGTTISEGMSSTSIFSLVREYLSQQNASADAISFVRTACLVLFAVTALVVLWTVRRGRELEPALIDTFLLFALLLSLLYPWYLITVFALLALRRTTLGFAFLCGATTLGLVYHPLSVWAWFNSGMSAFQIHLFQALFLTLPILAFLGLEIKGSHVLKLAIVQERVSQLGRRGTVGAAAGHVEGRLGSTEAGDGVTAAAGAGAPPAPRPRFRDRPRHWWVLAAAGRYEPAWVAAPSRPVPRVATPQASAATPPAPAPGDDAVAAGLQAPRRSRARTLRGLIAAAVALILLGVSIEHLRAPAAPTSTPAPAAPTAVPFAPLSGPSMMATAALGTQARLLQPREAVLLPHGQIAVADTGNRRVAILDASGHLLKSVRTGTLQEPYAVVASSHALFVLDAVRGSIERYDLAGRFEREIISNPPLLQDARGMALGPDGTLYVANPRTNSVVLLSMDGHIIRQLSSPLGAGPDQFNQPSDVAVSPNGTVYVLDDVNNRIKAMTPTGAFVAQWPAPPSDTLHSVHVLPLRGGRMLASDPFAGALLVYRPGGVPVRVPLGAPGPAAGSVQPLGLSLGPGGNVLVADGNGNRLLLVSSSELLRKAPGS